MTQETIKLLPYHSVSLRSDLGSLTVPFQYFPCQPIIRDKMRLQNYQAHLSSWQKTNENAPLIETLHTSATFCLSQETEKPSCDQNTSTIIIIDVNTGFKRMGKNWYNLMSDSKVKFNHKWLCYNVRQFINWIIYNFYLKTHYLVVIYGFIPWGQVEIRKNVSLVQGIEGEAGDTSAERKARGREKYLSLPPASRSTLVSRAARSAK